MKSNCFVLIAVSLLATEIFAIKPGSSTLVASQRKKAPLLKASHAGSLEQAVELRAASSGGSATMSTSVANLFKAIVGSGVLSLPVGIAAFSTSPSALKIALGMMAVIGVISAYCFTMVGRVVEATGTNTWGEAWGVAVGEGSKWVPTSLVALLTASASLQYTMIIGDSFAAIFKQVPGLKFLGHRSAAMWAITLCATLPLSLLPSLEALGAASYLGLGGLVYTALFMIARKGAYQEGGAYFEAIDAAMQPSLGAAEPVGAIVKSGLESGKIFVLVSIMATAFLAHFIAPQFYNELSAGEGADGKPATGGKMGRFTQLTGGGFLMSGLLSAVVMYAGFSTFGGACDGYILNNYASTDQLAQLARFAIGGSIVCTYPLIHQGLRDSIMEMTNTPRVPTSIAAVVAVTCIAMALTDLGVVAAVSGAFVSTTIGYILPSIMFGQLLASQGGNPVELVIARAVTVLGFYLVYIGMKAAF